MIVVDVETTGIDPRKHSIISIGAVDFNNPSNRFEIECRAFDGAEYEEEALAITGNTKERIFDSNKVSEGDAIKRFVEWTLSLSDHTVAGQNCYFDLEFLLAAAFREHLNVSLPKRIVDLHSVVWSHMISRGLSIPIDPTHHRSNINSDFITEYVGIPNEEKGRHRGITGALWEAEAFSRLLHNKSMIEEYSQYKLPWI